MDPCVNVNSQAAFQRGPADSSAPLGALRLRLRLRCNLCGTLSPPSAAGGEIFDHCASDELLPESQITRLIRQTLEGVHQLHQSNLVHLDLKVGARTRKIIYHCHKRPESLSTGQ